MANPNTSYDQVSAITERKFIPKLVDNIFDSNVLLKRFKEKNYEAQDGGTQIVQPLGYATNAASGWYSGSDTLDTTDNDQISAAVFDWKFIHATISIKGPDEIKNSGLPAILKLAAQKTKMAEKTLMDSLGTGLYNSGSDTKAIAGFRQLFSTSNTVGGISTSTNSWWRAQIDSSNTTLTIPVLQTQFTNCTIDSDRPTIVVSTRANYDRYYNQLQPQQRFMDSETAKGGFTSLMFNGVPWVPDSKCPTSHVLFLNENYLSLVYHPKRNFFFEPFAKPVNQDAKVAHVYWAGCFTTSNNRLHAMFTALAA